MKVLLLFYFLLFSNLVRGRKFIIDGSTSHSVCYWNSTNDKFTPYKSTVLECCDHNIRNIMKDAIKIGYSASRLGDLAKYIQRRVQVAYHRSFEVIISRENFAISSHYHGPHSCKIAKGNYFYLVYETPQNYNPFDMQIEDYLSTIDSADPLGSSKGVHRADFQDIREDPTAGDDLSIQPAINRILGFPNKFALPDPKEELYKAIAEAEKKAQDELEELIGIATEISVMNSNATNALNLTDFELPNPKAIPRNFANLREKDKLPKNTHCDKKRKDGNKCCDGILASTMRDSMRQMATSPDFGYGKEGIIAGELQNKIQQRFKKSFEVIVSPHNFLALSYNNGDNFCKFDYKGFSILAYTTPKQYDIDETEDEQKLARTSNRDPLGTNETHFSNKDPWHIPLQLERFGERAGYPVGSHCAESRTGSRCCSLILFNAMHSAYENHITNSFFDPYDLRNISTAIQWNVEEVLQHSAEVIVSLDDFAFATYHENSYTCKYRVDKYYLLAYTTPNNDVKEPNYDPTQNNDLEPYPEVVLPTTTSNPIQIYEPFLQYPQYPPQYQQQQYIYPHYPSQPLQYYPVDLKTYNQLIGRSRRYKRQIGASPYLIHQNIYNDVGSAKPFNCPKDLSGLSGMACCDGGLQYVANKVIDEAKQDPGFDKHNTRNLAKLMTRAVQKRFGTTFESVIAEADFSWGTNKFNARTCKIDSNGYSALTYQSSSNPPPASDFLDLPYDPTLGGPVGGGGGGGGSGSGSSNSDGSGSSGSGGTGGSASSAGFSGSGGQGGSGGDSSAFFAAASGAASLSGGGGGGGGGCFSLDTWVTTPNGKRRMDQINIGDYVLTANRDSTFFSPIILWIHREPDTVETMLTIMTEFGKTIRLTPLHFMFRNKCGDKYRHYVKTLPPDSQSVFAKDLRIGDCLIVMYKGKYRQQKIEEITVSRRKGIYSPLTSNGRIIVNDILASCYSEVKQSTLQTTFFWATSRIREKISDWIGYFAENKIELPTGTSLSKEIMKLILPAGKF